MVHERLTRNLGTLTPEELETIQSTTVAIAGAGLGSEVARQLTAFGFSITAIADPDTVEIHNLNRQHYRHHQIGAGKARSLAENIQQTNPDLDPIIFDEGITRENYVRFVESAEIIIDAIDPTCIHLSLAMTREAHRHGKTVVTAIDFGFGARVFVFPPEGPEIMNFMNLPEDISDEDILKVPVEQMMKPYMAGEIPAYVMEIIGRVAMGELNFYPQNILAVSIAATMITAACKRVALHQPVRSAPDYLHLDADWLLSQVSR